MKKVKCQHWQLSPNAILVAYILFLGRPMLVRVIWWCQRKLICLHGMDKRKGPLWLKPGICYTLLSVVNTWKSCPCHQQPQTYFVIPCKSCHHTWSYLVSILCHHDWWSCWPAKPTPPSFCKVWLGHQRWLSDSSKCKPTNRASGTNSDNTCNCIATGKTCSTKICSCNCEGISRTVQSCWYIFP